MERFNNIFSQFMTEFNLKIKLDENEYLKYYLDNVFIEMDNISMCNEDYFIHNTEKSGFIKLFKTKKYQENKINFWKYLHSLFLLVIKMDISELEQMSSKPITLIWETRDDIINNLKHNKPGEIFLQREQMKNMIEQLSKKTEHTLDNNECELSDDNEQVELPEFMKDSIIGKLAMDIGNDLKPSDMENFDPSSLLSGILNTKNNTEGMTANEMPGGNVLGDLMGKICGTMDKKLKSGEINQMDLMKEAQMMMGMFMGGGMGDIMQNMQKEMSKKNKK